MKDCGSHNGMVVMHAFDNTNCEKCNGKIVTEHMPGNKVCSKCSDEHGLCAVCGEEIKPNDIKHQMIADATPRSCEEIEMTSRIIKSDRISKLTYADVKTGGKEQLKLNTINMDNQTTTITTATSIGGKPYTITIKRKPLAVERIPFFTIDNDKDTKGHSRLRLGDTDDYESGILTIRGILSDLFTILKHLLMNIIVTTHKISHNLLTFWSNNIKATSFAAFTLRNITILGDRTVIKLNREIFTEKTKTT